MKQQYHLFIIALFLTAFSSAQIAQGPITVDNTTHTPQQLIQDILITGDCANTSNFNSSLAANPTGIAYFERAPKDPLDTTPENFPFENGIVLSTGNAMEAGGPHVNGLSNSNGAPGDDYLTGITGGTNDASFIEFDFVPPINVINFNYLFVSAEYNQGFECDYSDIFAFVLTDLNTGVVSNLAVLPTTDTGDFSVTCTNVRPAVAGSCGAANEPYFDRYNFDATDPTVATNSPIAYGGQTVGLTATGTVIPGNQYRIKLVIADDQDQQLDSAVFLEGGSFGLGITLDVGGLQIVDGVANACNALAGDPPTTVEIVGEVDGSTELPIDYQWSDVNGPIAGANTPNLIVTTTGTYTLTGSFTFPDGSSCSDSKDITINFFDTPVANQPQNLSLCTTNGTGFEEFNFTNQIIDIIGGQANMDVSFHTDPTDAQNNTNPITLLIGGLYTNVTNPETIYVRIDNNGNSDCFDTTQFEISVGDGITTSLPDNTIVRKCDDLADGTENFDITQFDSDILGALAPADHTILYYTTENDAINATNPILNTNPYPSAVAEQIIWVRVEDINNSACNAITSFTIYVDVIPVAVQPLEMRNCDVTPFGEETFDLTTQNEAVLGGPIAGGGLDPALYTVTYHWVDNTNPTTPVDMSIADPTTHTTIAPALSQEIFATVSNNANTDCTTVTSFFIFRDPIYTTAVPSEDLNLTECDYNNTGDLFEVFELRCSNTCYIRCMVYLKLMQR